MYKVIDVWKIISDNCAARYRCFQILSSGKYYVQTCDYYYLPIDSNQLRFLEHQFIELLIEDPPNINRMYSSLEEAIAMHDKEFNQ